MSDVIGPILGTETLRVNQSGFEVEATPAQFNEVLAKNGLGQASASKRVAIGILGQSNERGNVLTTDKAAYPQTFTSLRRPADCFMPIGPATAISGGWWPKVYDDLFDAGFDTQFVNGAIGSVSMVKHLAGFMTFRSNSTTYYRQRDPSRHPDRGFRGETICPNGNRVFRCTTGADVAALGNGPFRAYGSAATYLDYLAFSGTGATAASAPDFTTANVGDVVVDGGVSWTCEALTNTAYGGSGGTVFTENQHGLGFDPLGLVQRLHEEMQQVRGVSRKIIYLANGQSDTSMTAAWYSAALISVATFYLGRGYEVMIGLTCYAPNVDNTTGYNNLQTGRASAITALQASYPGKVHSGANLYALMGTTGPMANGGAYMQPDNVHLNGAGALAAGAHVSAAIRAVL